MGRLIKRYENRKLYDAQDRRYISLEEIATLVRQGEDIEVIDKSSGDDITTQTLTQVIFEEGKKGRNPLSTEMLHEVIRWSNNVIDDGFQQVRERIDNFVPPSLGKLFNPGGKEEMNDLKDRISSLEKMISELAAQADKEKNQ